jgi:hypothetical protein
MRTRLASPLLTIVFSKPIRGGWGGDGSENNPQGSKDGKLKTAKAKETEYAIYLASDAWREARRAFYARYPRRCRRCKTTRRLQLHHTTYRHIFDELNHLDDLVCLCKRCHAQVHDKPVRSWSRPNRKERRRKRKAPKPESVPRKLAGVEQAAKALERWREQKARKRHRPTVRLASTRRQQQ